MTPADDDRLVGLAARMAQAARDLADQDDPQTTLDAAVALAVENLAGCDAAGISIVRQGGRIDTPAATGPLVVEADRLQYETGEGPCLDSIWHRQTTYSPTLAHDDRWPTWGPLVVETTGARSVLAFQLFTTRTTLGALNLYSRADDGFDDTDRADGLSLASHIAVAVAAATQVANLTTALDSRTVIGKALGILMERYDLSDDRAFALLTRLSATEQVKVRDVAAHLVTTRSLPTPRDRPTP